MRYVIYFIDGPAREPVLVQDAEFLPRNEDQLCLQNNDRRTYTRWIIHSVVHNAMVAMPGTEGGYVAAPPNVYVRSAPKV